MNNKNFTGLRIWQEAHQLTTQVYLLTKKFPKEEVYGLVSQLRRAAVSIESNIAESHGRYHIDDVVRFLIDARGSIFEVQTQLMVARDVVYCNETDVSGLIDRYSSLARQINSLISYKRGVKKEGRARRV